MPLSNIFRFRPSLFKPNVTLTSVHQLSADLLRELEVHCVVFDVDDTLVTHRGNMVDNDTMQHLQHLRQTAGIKLYIASNSRRDLSGIADQLGAKVIRSTLLSRKPLRRHYRQIMREVACESRHAAMIGDRLTTDILGGNLAGMTTILVVPMRRLQRNIEQSIPGQPDKSANQPRSFLQDVRTWGSKYFTRRTPTGLQRTAWFFLAIGALLLFGLLLESVRDQDAIVRFDSMITSYAVEHRVASLTSLFLFLTAIAGTYATVLLLATWSVALRRRPYRRLAYILLVGAMLQSVVSMFIKIIVGRERPEQTLSLLEETTYSFPSGHTLTATVVWGIAAYLIARTLTARRYRVVVGLSYVIAIISIAASRVYLGVHYASDTLASVALGVGLVALYLAWSVGHPQHLPNKLLTTKVRWWLLGGYLFTGLAVLLSPNFFR